MSSSNSWKQYGGTRKPDILRNVTLGTIVADQVLIRDKFAGLYDFKGSVTIEGGLTLQDQFVGKENVYSIRDTNIGRDLYVKNKLYFGQGFSSYDDWFNTYADPTKTDLKTLPAVNTNTYMYGNNTSIGINTVAPTSIMEITSLLNTQEDILTVSSITATNRSIISQNMNKKGIVVTARDSSSNIEFFNDVTTSKTNVPDARIQYARGGNLILSSTNVNVTSSNYTNILSKFRISGRDTVDTINNNISVLNETAAIYDISAGNYQYNYYEKDYSYVGNALSLVSRDTSSVTLLNIVSPNKKGFVIGGGSYTNDTTRSMGTYGIIDNTGVYRALQTVVSGSNPLKYYSTMGINTYAPKTDKYIMDINGPVHISNGEINKIAQTEFEIIDFRFSKKDKRYALAVGSPSSVTKPTITNPKPFKQSVLYTKDGGNTWNTSRISVTSDLEFDQRFFKSYCYDSSFSIIGTNSFFMYYTVNGGYSWIPIYFYYPVAETVTNIYIADFLTAQRVLIVYTPIKSTVNKIISFDLSGGYKLFGGGKILYTAVNSPRIQFINNSDGYGDYVYFVGNGIEKYQISTLKSLYFLNTSYVYNSVAVYDNSFTIAVGQNIISYTQDGTNWTNRSTSSYGLTNIILNSVYIFDSNRAIAVGEEGVIVYTTDGSITWNFIPTEVLNSSGTASVITGQINKLRSIFIYDINSFYVSSVKRTYYLDKTAGTTDSVLGSSSIYYCYLPNVFNRINNRVFDISGNMAITGDMNVNDGGKIISNNPNFYLLNETVNQIYFGGSTAIINIGGDYRNLARTNINSDMYVYGDAHFMKGFSVVGEATFSGDMGADNLSVIRNVQIGGNTTMANQLYVGGDVSMNSDLYVNGNTYLHKSLDVRNSTILRDRLYVASDLNIYGRGYFDVDTSFNQNVDIIQQLNVLGDANFSNRLSITGDVSFNNNLDVITNLNVGSNLAIYGDTSLNGYLTVAYDTNLQGMLDVSENVYMRKSLDVSNVAYFRNSTIIAKDTIIGERLIVYNDSSLNSRLFVAEDANINGNVNVGSNLAIYGDTSLNGYLTVAYDTNLQGMLDVSENVYMRKSLDVSNVAYFRNSTIVAKDTIIGERLIVYNDSSLNSRLFVADDTNLNGFLTIQKNAIMNSGLLVTLDTSLNRNVTVLNDANIKNRLMVTFDACFNRNVTVLNDATIGNRLIVTFDACFNRNIAVLNDANINRLFVTNDTNLNGNVNVVKNINLTGNMITTGDTALTGNLIVYGDVSFNKKLSIGNNPIAINKAVNYPNTIMDINGNVIATYLGVGTNSVKNNCSLDINGDTNTNGCVFQF